MNQKKLHILLISILLLCCSATLTSAQVSYGLKLMSGQKIRYHEFYDNKRIYHFTPVGIGANVNIPLTNKLGLQPELTYLTPIRDLLSYHMVSLPVMLTYQSTESISIEAGPSVEREFSNRDNSKRDRFFKPDYNLGANLGVGIKLSNQWMLGFRYTYETFRTKHAFSGFTANDANDPLIGSFSGWEPGWRDTAIVASIQYKLK